MATYLSRETRFQYLASRTRVHVVEYSLGRGLNRGVQGGPDVSSPTLFIVVKVGLLRSLLVAFQECAKHAHPRQGAHRPLSGVFERQARDAAAVQSDLREHLALVVDVNFHVCRVIEHEGLAIAADVLLRRCNMPGLVLR